MGGIDPLAATGREWRKPLPYPIHVLLPENLMFIDILFVVVTAIVAWHGLTWRDDAGESDAVRLLFGSIALLFCVRVLFVDILKVF